MSKNGNIIRPVLLGLLAAAAVTSCGCSEANGGTGKVSSKVKDHKAYNLGQEHAGRLLEHAGDEARVQDGLLDIRARISNIQSKLGAQAAADYERGFTDYVKTSNDSLARLIF